MRAHVRNTRVSKAIQAALATAALAVSTLPSLASAEQLTSAQRAVQVRYKSGETEHYVVTWSADVTMSVGEDGGPSKPLEGHFVDDRRCHWSINGGITRQVFLVSRTGQQYASPTLSKVYNKAQANEGSSFLLVGLRSENCGDAAGRRSSDYENMKRAVLGVFHATIEHDLGSVKEEVRQSAGVLRISEDKPKK
jgi:hypothetical protein